jgi:hypothetical protein
MYAKIFYCGDVAQLAERLNGIQEVVGSIPIISTKDNNPMRYWRRVFILIRN